MWKTNETNMLFLTTQECKERAIAKGFAPDPTGKQFIRPHSKLNAIRISTEQVNHKSYALARTLVKWLDQSSGALLWITEYGIWPSSENLHLYNRLRKSYGDSSKLDVTPGHFFGSGEEDDLISFLELSLRFGWGGYLFGASTNNYFILSHDGWVAFETVTTLDGPVSDAIKLGVVYKTFEAA